MDFSSQFTVIPLPFPNLLNTNDYQNESPASCYLVKLSNGINILCDCPLDLKQAYSINIEMDSSALVPSQHNMITDWSYAPQTIDLNAYVTKPRDSTYSLFPWIILPKWDLVDFGTLDYILISNHHLITALPYITEYTNFKGQILATSPIKHFAR
jgi:integrator complex subunit 9